MLYFNHLNVGFIRSSYFITYDEYVFSNRIDKVLRLKVKRADIEALFSTYIWLICDAMQISWEYKNTLTGSMKETS